MSTTDAFVAATRFGLGARPGDLETIAPDPKGWLLAQLDGADPTAARLANETSTVAQVREFMSMRGASETARDAFQISRRRTYTRDMSARELAAASTDAPFRERWVRHWSNHFTVSVVRNEVLTLAGPFEREAIRPYCTGRFADLLVATTRHPAMQTYLDNARSIGPESMAGRRRDRGLNENLAREILELHTLGVNGGYAQPDVEALARILTGWTVSPERGSFLFDERRHEPGSKTLLGRRYPEGLAGGVAALRDLADHPSTAENVATRVARHFVADTPPASLVKRLAEVFTDTGGDLAALATAVVNEPAAWEPLTKVKTPADLITSTTRALAFTESGDPLLESRRFLGQPPFRAPSPQGWPDTTSAWLGPEALMGRLEWIEGIAAQAAGRVDPRALADSILGPVLTRSMRRQLAESSDDEALALLLASPTFQRR